MKIIIPYLLLSRDSAVSVTHGGWGEKRKREEEEEGEEEEVVVGGAIIICPSISEMCLEGEVSCKGEDNMCKGYVSLHELAKEDSAECLHRRCKYDIPWEDEKERMNGCITRICINTR